MIYCIIYDYDKENVKQLAGDFLEWNVPAKDRKEVIEIAKRRLKRYGYSYATIFTLDSNGVTILAIVDNAGKVEEEPGDV